MDSSPENNRLLQRIGWPLAFGGLLIVALVFNHQWPSNHSGTSITRVAFGSCNTTRYAQPIWSAVLEAKPDIWIWTGDIIYADSRDTSRHRRLYAIQKRHPKYRELLQSTLVTGTWDDHDYGANNSGKEYPEKVASQQALLDFLDVPANDQRRHREGVYTSQVFGPVGKRVKIILLDTRYFREAPGPEGDILGNVQWEWLSDELQANNSDLTLLVSSIAVIPRGPRGTEGWYRFPAANRRLGKLIALSHAPVILLTGDRHFAEISRFENDLLSWPLYEVMSSGMTHAANNVFYENPYREGQLYTALNFGLIDIRWSKETITVTLQVRDAENQPRINKRVSFNRPDG